MGNLWKRKKSQPQNEPEVTILEPVLEEPIKVQVEEMNFSSDDPLLAYLVNIASVIELERINIKSPTLDRMREDGEASDRHFAGGGIRGFRRDRSGRAHLRQTR